MGAGQRLPFGITVLAILAACALAGTVEHVTSERVLQSLSPAQIEEQLQVRHTEIHDYKRRV